jgi:hypothetical protein
MKGALRLRPVFHYREDRIRAHVQLCWLALLIRVAENAASGTWRNIRHELDRMHLVTLATAGGRAAQRSLTTPASRSFLFVSGLLADRRREIGTRRGTRALTCFRQAVFVLGLVSRSAGYPPAGPGSRDLAGHRVPVPSSGSRPPPKAGLARPRRPRR